jgi:hypothetical protein
MGPWTKVVTEPLGLAGFALFLVFGYLARVKRNDQRRWLSPVALGIATIALVGGLVISYVQVSKTVAPPVQNTKQAAPTQHQTNQQIQQSSTGPCSPNVQGVQGGNVTITADQSSCKTEIEKPPEKKVKPENK